MQGSRDGKAPERRRLLLGATAWLLAWIAMFLLDGHIDLGNQALILILAAAVAALWLPRPVSMAVCAFAVLAFNFSFVPPRGTFAVGLEQHVLLLITTLVVSWLIALMVERQGRLAETERMHRARAEQLRGLGEALRDADDPLTRASMLQSTLAQMSGAPATLLVLSKPPSDDDNARDVPLVGEASPDERVALWLCMRQAAMTGGTGAPEYPVRWYIPMRGRGANYGAALIRFPSPPSDASTSREHAQALCDQMGLALERYAALRAAFSAQEAAQAQALRNTLLAAIAHDHRTPLATILGAGSSLLEQSDRLSPEQRRRLAATIVDEATQLARLTENTLQLARLDAQHASLNSDWESVEELVGTVARRVRQRDPERKLAVAVEGSLPLLRCDAVLLVQLLDNLVDNAFKHGGGDVELRAFQRGHHVVISVQDRGTGVPEAWRARIFDAFQRVPGPRAAHSQRGAGVGLTVCSAIARAHGGELNFHARDGGGACFELSLPIEAVPAHLRPNER
ncbi:MAG: ATP-binding protein [Burkholderiaceae bacterium]